MNVSRPYSLLSLLSALFLSRRPAARADQWTAPTPEELSMTSQPEVPGAAAVYLFREETTDDKLHMFSIYVRLKVLTERGKEYGNVELQLLPRARRRWLHRRRYRRAAPFTPTEPSSRSPASPTRSSSRRPRASRSWPKVFTMPDVEVGSIIEYRYKLRYDDQYFEAPRLVHPIRSLDAQGPLHCGSRSTSTSTHSVNDDRGQDYQHDRLDAHPARWHRMVNQTPCRHRPDTDAHGAQRP